MSCPLVIYILISIDLFWYAATQDLTADYSITMSKWHTRPVLKLWWRMKVVQSDHHHQVFVYWFRSYSYQMKGEYSQTERKALVTDWWAYDNGITKNQFQHMKRWENSFPHYTVQFFLFDKLLMFFFLGGGGWYWYINCWIDMMNTLKLCVYLVKTVSFFLSLGQGRPTLGLWSA